MTQNQMPNIFQNSQGEEWNWRIKHCFRPCGVCFALTTITYIKNDIAVLTFCHFCQKATMHNNPDELIE